MLAVWVEVVCDLQKNTVNVFTMPYTKSLQSRANEDGLICIAIDMQNPKFETNSILTGIKNEFSEMNFLDFL